MTLPSLFASRDCDYSRTVSLTGRRKDHTMLGHIPDGASMDLQLESSPTLIIGAAKGIGRAIAEAFAREGARVTLADIDPKVEDAAREVAGGTADSLVVDATDFDALASHARRTAESNAFPQHVVYAAGAGSGKFGFPFWNLDPCDWERVLKINLLGAVNVATAFLPGMTERGRGTFLFLASVAGQMGSQTDPPYSAAKAAVINFAQCAAKDAAASGVRVNVISPGMVKTDLNRSVWQSWADRQPEKGRQTYEEWAEQKISTLTPMGRWQTPEDIAAAAVFLASPLAGNITGQTINVDGGWIMHS